MPTVSVPFPWHSPGALRLCRRLGRVSAAGALFAAGACDQFLPTEAPNWTTRWIVPTDSTTIAVSSLLPSSGTVRLAGNAFEVSIPGVTVSRSLGEILPGLPPGTTPVPAKPAFDVTLQAELTLPADVVSATVTGGTVVVALGNGFSFDPLRPGGASTGTISVRVSSGSTVLASNEISGANTAFPPGSTLNRTLSLSGATVSGPVQVSVRIVSPQGGPTTVNRDQRISVQVTPQAIRASEAQVRVQNQRIDAQEVRLDLSGIDQAVIDRVQGGALLFDLVNPFAVAGNLNVSVTGGAPISQQIQLRAGGTGAPVQRDSLVLTKEQLRSVLGRQNVSLSATGTVSSATGSVAVNPSQAVVVRTRLRLDINVKAD